MTVFGLDKHQQPLMPCSKKRAWILQLRNPEIDGIEYQQGTLFGYEIREYLLEKWVRQCAYCDAAGCPLQIEHIVPKSRGGSNRIDNLTLAYQDCNLKKSNAPLEIFSPKRAKAIKAKSPLQAAAAVNSTRNALWDA